MSRLEHPVVNPSTNPDDVPVVVELIACPSALPRPIGAVAEMTYRHDAWTPDEIATLRRLFADDVPVTEIAALLGRGRAGVADRIYLLGLRRHTARAWTEWDDAELIRRYGQEAAATIASDLVRSCRATYVRAALLGLAQESPPPWTAWEDAQLRAGYETAIPVGEIAAIIGRPRSGTASRASTLCLRHPDSPRDWTPTEIERAFALHDAGHS